MNLVHRIAVFLAPHLREAAMSAEAAVTRPTAVVQPTAQVSEAAAKFAAAEAAHPHTINTASTPPRPLGAIQADLENVAAQAKQHQSNIAVHQAAIVTEQTALTASTTKVASLKAELEAGVSYIENEANTAVAGAKSFLQKLGL